MISTPALAASQYVVLARPQVKWLCKSIGNSPKRFLNVETKSYASAGPNKPDISLIQRESVPISTKVSATFKKLSVV